jgi:quinol monooxygenase YgiN
MIMLHVTYRFAPEKVNEAIEYFRKMQPASRAEPGCITYTVYRAKEDAATFYIHEEWRDQAALEAHQAMPHFQEFAVKGLRPLSLEREVHAGEPLIP